MLHTPPSGLELPTGSKKSETGFDTTYSQEGQMGGVRRGTTRGKPSPLSNSGEERRSLRSLSLPPKKGGLKCFVAYFRADPDPDKRDKECHRNNPYLI